VPTRSVAAGVPALFVGVELMCKGAAMNWVQRWTDVLFLHYPVSSAELEPLLPAGIEPDLCGERAWISFVLFRLHVRPGWLPSVPGLSSLLELNLRTYVRHRGQPGICFLGMHADNCLAIRVARLLTPLRYLPAHVVYDSITAGWWRAECRHAENPDHRLSVRFRASGPAKTTSADSLDAWLLERYRLFVGGRDGAVIAADVEHAPWQVSPVEAIIDDHTIATASGVSLTKELYAAHFSSGVTARFQPFRTVSPPPRS